MNPIIKCEHTDFGYENHDAVIDLNLEIYPGDYLCVVGENGSGKSTLIKGMLGLLKPTGGSLSVADELKRGGIGYLPQQTAAQKDFPATVQEVVLSGTLSRRGNRPFYSRAERKLAAHNLERLGIEHLKQKCYRELSGGQQQRVLIARALCATEQLLILDEPASGLDPRTRVEYTAILKELRDQGKTLLVSSHILSELSELCTSIGIIEQGRTVLQGSMDQIFARINSSNPLLISIFSQKEKALAILKSHPCVQTIAVQGDEIKLGFLGDRQDEALLLQQLIDADVMVSSFMREKGSLESLFMQITGHEEERAVLKHEMESGI